MVLGRSNIVGVPAATLLQQANATVTICHSRTPDIPAIVREVRWGSGGGAGWLVAGGGGGGGSGVGWGWGALARHSLARPLPGRSPPSSSPLPPSPSLQADILVAAIGKAEFVQGEWLKPGAVVIDVGINSLPDASKKAG